MPDHASALRGLLLREGMLIVLLALAGYLFLALSSYSPLDPGWSRTGDPDNIANDVGRSGAWLADVLLLLFGYLAYLFPLMLVWRALLIFRERRQAAHFSWELFALRSAGFVLTLVAAATLASIHFVADMPESAGGILGATIAAQALPAFDMIGTTLIFLSILFVGITLGTGLSWLTLVDSTGRLCLESWDFLLHRWRHWRDVRREREETRQSIHRRKEALDHFIEKDKSRKPITIAPVRELRPEASKRVLKEKQGKLFAAPAGSELPPINLLDPWVAKPGSGYSKDALEAMSRLLEIKLKDFGIDIDVVAINPGPVITRFEVQPAPGVKVSRISNLVKDLARSLAVSSVRVVEVIPGKTVVGIEIPNDKKELIQLSQVLSSSEFDNAKSPISLALGHDIGGHPVVVDLGKMPHLLVAGTTGSGKSVGVNAMILSMLFKASPRDVRMIMIDPKMLELSVYDGIPHLLTPVITDMKEAANGLRWCVAEMERRYKLMSAMGVRNLAGFNKKVADANKEGAPIKDPLWRPDPMLGLEEQSPDYLEELPFIVVLVDELADMMMVVGKKVEELIARIAQKARAAGIHLILATQRPSVDVLTGLIKANIPTRLSFMVQSKIDSRTILGEGGAEQLLGHGDMLFLPPGGGVAQRVHGAFVSDEEVHRVAADWRARGQPRYIESITAESSGSGLDGYGGDTEAEGNSEEDDALYDEAVRFVTESRKASISAVQRKLRIGYNRAARMIEAMEMAGVVSEMSSNGNREVLAPPPPRN
ncbi:MAG: DNA translocase FtsK 4TM domain-containing protein [Pseudomonadales bacterium]|nr:DNA translocase FtsK 4TM domain-containing protein [Pseudomonadales bacterium]